MPTPLVVSGGVDIYDNVCRFGCLGDVLSPSRTSLGFVLGTAVNVTDAQGASGPGLYPCSSPDVPTVDVCTCQPSIANATVTPSYETASQIPAGYPTGWRRSVAADVVCDAGLVFRGLRGPFNPHGRVWRPSPRSPGTVSRTTVAANRRPFLTGPVPGAEFQTGVVTRLTRRHRIWLARHRLAALMPVGSCETTGDDPMNLDCILNCPANYRVNNAEYDPLPITFQCLYFELATSRLRELRVQTDNALRSLPSGAFDFCEEGRASKKLRLKNGAGELER